MTSCNCSPDIPFQTFQNFLRKLEGNVGKDFLFHFNMFSFARHIISTLNSDILISLSMSSSHKRKYPDAGKNWPIKDIPERKLAAISPYN